MGANFDIYGIPQKLQRYRERIAAAQDMCDENKKAIAEFFEYCSATGLSQVRILFYAMRLLPIARMLKKPFREATRQDIQALVAQIEQNPRFAPWTKQIYRTSIKKFYKWLEGNGEEFPDKVKWIKTGVGNGASKMLPEELLTPEEVRKLVEVAENPKDKALISCLYESGCRVGEILGLKIKHVSFDQYGAQIMVNGKTGMRRVRLVASLHPLSYWLEHHPWKTNPDSPLWPCLTTSKRGLHMNYAWFNKHLRELAEAAGIRKPCNPHSFRHSRATHLAKLGLNEVQMSAFLGWVPGTNMTATYVHLAGRDVDDAILKAHGIIPKSDNGELLVCPRCAKQNTIVNRFCAACGMPLTTSAAVGLDDKRAAFEESIGPLMELLNDKSVRKFIAQKLAQRRSST